MVSTGASPPLALLDPYLAWAQATRFAALLQRPRNRLRVAFQFADEAQCQGFAAQYQACGVGLAPHYVRAVQQGDCRFACGDVLPADLPRAAALACRIKVGRIGNAEQQPLPAGERVSMADFESPMLKAKAIRRMRRAIADRGAGRIDGLRKIAKVGKAPAIEAKGVAPRAEAAAGTPAGAKAPIMAVIDFGCAFAHQSFRRGQGTRVLHFWDQGRDADAGKQDEIADTWPWQPESEFGYGREADGQRLSTLMDSVREEMAPRDGPTFSVAMEEACYLRAALPELLEPWTHGTAVTGMAAGALPKAAQGAPEAAGGSQPPVHDDVAGEADLIFVQLPEAAIEDLSGGWVTTYVLDALGYAMAKAGDRPLVVNISIGSHGGPHDGGSLLEAAIEAFMDKREGLHVVLAAGNAAGRRGHAVAAVPPNTTASLRWVVPARDPTQSFLEFWYPRQEGRQPPEFTVRGPDGAVWLTGQAAVAPRRGAPCAALWHAPTAATGNNSGMALFALAPTIGPASAKRSGMGVAPAGVWTIEVHNPADQALEVHAWIERDEPGAGPLADRPDSVLVAPPGSAFTVSDASTVTGQATGARSWVVGGYELHHPAQKDEKADPIRAKDSGRGPGRGAAPGQVPRSPDLFAPADRWVDGATRGLRALANRSPQKGQALPDIDGRGFAALRGTSLAAPWVARQLYNLMANSAPLSRQELKAKLLAAREQIRPPIYGRAVEWPPLTTNTAATAPPSP